MYNTSRSFPRRTEKQLEWYKTLSLHVVQSAIRQNHLKSPEVKSRDHATTRSRYFPPHGTVSSLLAALGSALRMTLLHYCWPIAYKFDRRRQKTGESWRRSIMALEEVHKKDEFDQILADSSRWAYCVSTIHLACAERKKNDFFNGLKSCKIPKANVHIKISWLQMKKIYFGLLYYWLVEPYSFFSAYLVVHSSIRVELKYFSFSTDLLSGSFLLYFPYNLYQLPKIYKLYTFCRSNTCVGLSVKF